MTPGTRYLVSLGRDEEAQLAVAGSLTLAAARFIRQPVYLDPRDQFDGLPSSGDAYAAMSWDTSLRGKPEESADD